MGTEEAKKNNKKACLSEKKPCCEKNKCKAKPKSKNGKGDVPRNNHSDKFRNNYDNINWSDG